MARRPFQAASSRTQGSPWAWAGAGALAGLVMPVGMSQAQNAWYWNTGSGAWDLASPNWLQLGLPAAWNDGGTNDAQFAGFLSSGRVVTLSGDRTVGSLAFHGLGGSFYTMGSNSIILNKSLGDDSIAVGRGVLGGASSAAAGGHTAASNLIFNSNLAINNAGTFGLTSLTLSGSISRATAGGSISYTGTGNAVVSGSIDSSVTGGIVKSGKGTLHLSGTNAFTGDVTVDGGVLSFASDAALGAASNSITLNSGGTLRSTGNSTLNPSRAINVAGASRIDMTTGTTLTTSALAGSGDPRAACRNPAA